MLKFVIYPVEGQIVVGGTRTSFPIIFYTNMQDNYQLSNCTLNILIRHQMLETVNHTHTSHITSKIQNFDQMFHIVIVMSSSGKSVNSIYFR